tara:strand:- start:138 stop:482 length:345 start_codon:yes stop_codon:yes gene_type:complete
MPKHYKEMMDEIINKIDEDAPANSVAGGGVDMAPNARHPLTKSYNKYKKDNEKISQKMKMMMTRNEDNNNVVLRSINEKISNIEDKLDEKLFGKTELKVEEEKEYKSFRDKYNA